MDTELTAPQLREARAWLTEIGVPDVKDMTDRYVVKIVHANYDGGIGQFANDTQGL